MAHNYWALRVAWLEYSRGLEGEQADSPASMSSACKHKCISDPQEQKMLEKKVSALPCGP